MPQRCLSSEYERILTILLVPSWAAWRKKSDHEFFADKLRQGAKLGWWRNCLQIGRVTQHICNHPAASTQGLDPHGHVKSATLIMSLTLSGITILSDFSFAHVSAHRTNGRKWWKFLLWSDHLRLKNAILVWLWITSHVYLAKKISWLTE